MPNMMSHSGCLTRSESDCGSRRDSILTALASSISSGVRWRMKTGLPRHLIMTWKDVSHVSRSFYFFYSGEGRQREGEGSRTFLPSGMAERSTSTLAIARTSAEADILTRKSADADRRVSDHFPLHREGSLPSLVAPSLRSKYFFSSFSSSSPWIVAFAPAADRTPMVPTMKYPNSLLVPALPPLYLLKSGIRVVSFLPADAKGDW